MSQNIGIFDDIIDFIRRIHHKPEGFIPLHEPRFIGNERVYVADAIDSTFVSSIGEYVDRFEEKVCRVTGAAYAIATVNGTSALHAALVTAGVKKDDEVITQPLTFVATANAITYGGALPVFVDVDKDTLSLSPSKLADFLKKNSKLGSDGYAYNKLTGHRLKACVPVYTFGFPGRIEDIRDICSVYNITLIEDAAESLGSTCSGRHTGTFGLAGIFSFNGNKTITAGGGGAIITDDADFAKKARHLATTGKVPHKWEYVHDVVAYNYRMPNLNAALVLAQIEKLDEFIKDKRAMASEYSKFFEKTPFKFIKEQNNTKANYWLNAILFNNREERDAFLTFSNEHQVMTRPAWQLMHRLEMFNDCCYNNLENAEWLVDRLVNIPSSVRVTL